MSHVDAPRAAKSSSPSAGVIALIVVLLAGFVLLPRLLKRAGDHALVGQDAPDFTLKVLANEAAGQSITLSELRGKAVVLDFWASWCGPCRQEAPIMSKFAQRMRERGVVVVGVNTNDEDIDAARLFASQKMSFPVVVDGAGATRRSYGVEGLPTLVVVSRQGKVIAVRSGVTDDSELERLVAQAL